MLDDETARAAADALTTAIAALLEHGLDAAACIPEPNGAYAKRAILLRQIADDAVVLTAALLVLARKRQAYAP